MGPNSIYAMFAFVMMMSFVINAVMVRRFLQWLNMALAISCATGILLGGYFAVDIYSKREKQGVLEMIRGFAPTYAIGLRDRGLLSIDFDTSPSDPVYLKLIEVEKTWLSTNPAVTDVYVFKKKNNGKLALLVDSETDYDRNGVFDGDREQRTAIGEEYTQMTEGIQKAFTGVPAFDSEPVTDRWGTWVSAYVPVFDENGAIHSVVGVDYPAEKVLIAGRRATYAVVGVMFIVILILQIGGNLILYQSSSLNRVAAAKMELKSVLDSLPDLILVLDSQGKVRKSFNHEHISFGRNSVSWKGEDFKNMCPSQVWSRVLASITQVMKTRKPTYHKLSFQNSRNVFHADARVVYKDSHEVLMCLRDTTAATELEKRLDEQKAQVAQSAKMASLGEMSSGVAHEINNPLAIIRGKSEQVLKLLSQSHFNVDLAKAGMVKIIEVTDRIAKIVKGLRTFSRNSESDPMVNTSLTGLVEDALSLCSERFRNHGVNLTIGTIPDIEVECRPVQISQVLLNLLNNAFDAIQDHQEKWVRVDILHKQTSSLSTVELSVTDSGNGIPQNVVEKMMQPFFTTKEVGKGTGLGLSISMGIAEGHQGQLRYDESSKNTRFVLEIPTRQNDTLKKSA